MTRLALLLACAISLITPHHLRADDAPTAPVARAMADAANKVLASLDDAQKAKVVMKFDDPARLDWHNIPKPVRKGVQLREMTPEQQKLCHELLKSALSDSGYEKAARIMSLENNLREGEKNIQNGNLRDPLRYFLTVFGTPSDKGTWGWSFEGHHFSLNFAVRDGLVIGETPSFWGANPATVYLQIPGGPEKGIRTLAKEEQLAFDLVNSLDDAQKKKAIIAEKAPAEYRNAGNPEPPKGSAEGISAKDLNEAQRKLLWSLLETYNSHLEDALAAERLKELDAAGLDNLSFAWLGSTKPHMGHSYRIQGPTFLLELINVQSDTEGTVANHIHSVWRSLTRDFGLTAK